MWLFLFWWCVDDTIAAAVETPGLGELPLWVPLILSLALSTSISAGGKRKNG
ncbi:MAG: hypothetical protein AAF216_07795 [Pseudomonadota bacterium]